MPRHYRVPSSPNPPGVTPQPSDTPGPGGSVPAGPEPRAGLFADDPIEFPTQDLLGRSRFALGIARLLKQTAMETGSAVLALIGPWGTGKTSVLNLVAQTLDQASDWAVVEFNPWQSPDLTGMFGDFFAALRGAIPETTDSSRKESIRRYALAVSPWAGILKVPGVDIAKVLDQFSEALRGDQSLAALQQAAAKQLSSLEGSVLVIVDDVDRLFPDELLILFKLVRLIGKLPHIYYLLAFDEKTLLDMLGETSLARDSPARALAYLEKMIQLRVDLPPMHESEMRQLLGVALDDLVRANSISWSTDAQERFSVAYYSLLQSTLRSPRSIRRYVAQIQAYFPFVNDEVEPADFFLLTFFRTFMRDNLVPAVYRALPDWKKDLTDRAMPSRRHGTATIEPLLDRWTKRLEVLSVAPEQIRPTLEVC
jgi:predicted KAP-like P-loop ATPase